MTVCIAQPPESTLFRRLLPVEQANPALGGWCDVQAGPDEPCKRIAQRCATDAALLIRLTPMMALPPILEKGGRAAAAWSDPFAECGTTPGGYAAFDTAPGLVPALKLTEPS